MAPKTRVMGATAGISCAIGLLVLIIVGFATGTGPSPEAVRYTFTSGTGLANVAALFLLIALPASLPATLAGGWLAARALERAAHLPLLSCAGRGVAQGVGLGAAGCLFWFGGINLGERLSAELLRFLCLMGLVGGVAGSVVGGLVGTYCWSLTRRRVSDGAGVPQDLQH